MAEEDIAARRARELAEKIHYRNREDAIGFYKSLAAMDLKPISPKLLEEDSGSSAIRDAESLLKKKLDGLREGGGDVQTGRFSAALFVLDRARKIRAIALKQDRNSLFSLFISLRDRIGIMLSESYYGLSEEEALDEFIATEPLLYALSELCGLSMPTMDDIVRNYRA